LVFVRQVKVTVKGLLTYLIFRIKKQEYNYKNRKTKKHMHTKKLITCHMP